MSERQSIIFFKTYGWTEAKAKKWLKMHDLHPIKHVDKKGTELRYRLIDPRVFRRFRILKLNNGIDIVLGFH